MLKAKSVTIVPLTLEDLPYQCRWINKREQVLLNAPYKRIADSQHRAWFDSIKTRNDFVLFGIRLLQTNKSIGLCQLQNINYIHRSAELEILLGNSSRWGKGYGTEAVQLLLEFAFKDLNLNRVQLRVFETNKRAIRVYEKVGFVREGILRKAAFIDGANIDVVVMGILREEYVR